MNKPSRKHTAAVSTVIALAALFTAPAQAYDYSLRLCQIGGLAGSSDANGVTAISKGAVYYYNTRVGDYVQTNRSLFGSSANEGSVEIFVLWSYGDYNFTLQGLHSYSTGQQRGGVSAASPGFTAFDAATFVAAPSGSCRNLTVTY